MTHFRIAQHKFNGDIDLIPTVNANVAYHQITTPTQQDIYMFVRVVIIRQCWRALSAAATRASSRDTALLPKHAVCGFVNKLTMH